MPTRSALLVNEAATLQLGFQLAVLFKKSLERASEHPLCVYLEGDLGAGKTTLTRGLLTALGHSGVVKSPTYTLVESYNLKQEQCSCTVYHFDLYRLHDPEELEMMGIRDYFSSNTICLIEWPERGAYVLPEPDLRVELKYLDEGRNLTLSSTYFSSEDLEGLEL